MSATAIQLAPHDALVMLLRVLKLPTVARHAEEIAGKAERVGERENPRNSGPGDRRQELAPAAAAG